MARNLTRRGNYWIFRKEVDGKEYRISTRCRDRKLAEKVALQIETDVVLGKHGLRPPPTWGDYSAGLSHRARSVGIAIGRLSSMSHSTGEIGGLT